MAGGAKKNEVAKIDEATASAALTAWGEGPEGPTGFEDMTSDDFAIPFIALLQKNSPQVDESDGAYIEGAKPGMFLDTATGEVMPYVDFIPVYHRRAMVEWKDRKKGEKGFVATHEVGYEAGLPRDEHGRFVTAAGTVVMDTRYVFGHRVVGTSLFPGVISFQSTQIKKGRSWMEQARRLRAPNGRQIPMMACVYRITSVDEERNGNRFKGYKIDRIEVMAPSDPRFIQAQRDYDMFRGANVAPPAETDGADKDVDSDIPF